MILSKPINNTIKVKVNTILKAAKRRADNYFDENIKSKIKDLDNYDSLLILAKEREALKKKISKSEYIFYIEYASSPQWLISQYASRTFLLNVDESEILEEAAFLEKYRSNVYKAIDKIKKETSLVKRGADLPKEVLDQHCLNCVVEYKAFTSTSKENGFKRIHRFIIQSKTGRYIDPISSNPGEQEILFKPGTKFKVLKIQKNDKDIEFTMEEVN